MADDIVEQTLHVARHVSVYTIPPRGPSGHASGEWLVGSRIFQGRLRVVARGTEQGCEIRFEDPQTDQLFACCPIEPGKRNVCVEPAVDSKRNFCVRVEDPATKRHAFLGLGFDEREAAFDFLNSLIKHEQWVERERAAAVLRQHGGTPPSIAAAPGGRPAAGMTQQLAMATKEVASLYARQGDLSLKEGQTIHVNLKKPVNGGATTTQGSTLQGSTTAGGGGVLPAVQLPGGAFKLAPPPADLSGGGYAPPSSSSASRSQPSLSQPHAGPFDPFAAAAPASHVPSGPFLSAGPAPAPISQPLAVNSETGWATFD